MVSMIKEILLEVAVPHKNVNASPALHMDLLSQKGVEYVAIINKKGRIEDAIYKDDIKLSSEKKVMFSLTLQLQNSMQSDFDEEFGSVNYTIIQRENSKFVLIPISQGMLLVKLAKSRNPFRFITKVAEVLSLKLAKTRNEVLQ